METPRPLLTEGAIEFLDGIITKDTSILEFGSGGSTIWFAERCREIVSVDHQRKYYEMAAELENCGARLVETKQIPGSDLTEIDYSFIADEYPDEYFDFVLIDGRNRVACFKKSLPKLKKGGYIMLDNSDRPALRECYDNDMEYIEFKNTIPGLPWANPTWMTTVWKKR